MELLLTILGAATLTHAFMALVDAAEGQKERTPRSRTPKRSGSKMSRL